MQKVTLFRPTVRYFSTSDGQFDPMMTWRAELEMAYLDGDDLPRVRVGYAEFATIRTGEQHAAELLDGVSQDAERFGVLFDEKWVAHGVQEQFEAMPILRVLIVTLVHLAEPVRGQDLGAWLVAEVISRMAGACDTLVLLYPVSAWEPADADAVNALTAYWMKIGLEPIDIERQFLGHSTAYAALSEARQALRFVDKVEVSVPVNWICTDPNPLGQNNRHMLDDTA